MVSSSIALSAVEVRRVDKMVISGVDLAVRPGSWFGLIGANGSGKTSLLRAIAGRLPIETGRCLINGLDLANERAARARLVGFAPSIGRLPDRLRGREILQLAGQDLGDCLERLGPLREALGVDPLLGRWIGDCSAGMRQRLAIACAFASGCSVVILDEPFNWLDPVAAFDVRHALRLMVEGGLTLLTALHDLGTLALACDEGVMLADGAVALRLESSMLRQASRNLAAFEQGTIDLMRSKCP